jgi:hypothetical protein
MNASRQVLAAIMVVLCSCRGPGGRVQPGEEGPPQTAPPASVPFAGAGGLWGYHNISKFVRDVRRKWDTLGPGERAARVEELLHVASGGVLSFWDWDEGGSIGVDMVTRQAISSRGGERGQCLKLLGELWLKGDLTKEQERRTAEVGYDLAVVRQELSCSKTVLYLVNKSMPAYFACSAAQDERAGKGGYLFDVYLRASLTLDGTLIDVTGMVPEDLFESDPDGQYFILTKENCNLPRGTYTARCEVEIYDRKEDLSWSERPVAIIPANIIELDIDWP